ncbi:uncharacterized protein FOMMEDRAFT_106372 [Fomitiporia mediterranea MF3/22]|uniref:uncharacterized protein n=1 Tax=Fomitiporia mediterranea (strain MF3/22) TaxID=694068 RepID=UPI0004409BB4|nr:uncharacterized protein FOMMEDRAFT_106372 [Fomitiporia mediterranea MF3/22]EJD03992.1 hypothetical protein FOMMEDRAFT_106372 [Fomitiporia mediterranea MF3/22]
MAESERNGARDELPRVSVDSIQDWFRIKENLNSAAIAILDSKLSERGSENQRNLLLPHVIQFLERTYRLAKPNLRINGRNFDEYDGDEQEMDQFDESLDRRVWSLSDQRLKWDLEIATKRRNVPREVENLMLDLFNKQREHDDRQLGQQDTEMEVDNDVAGGEEGLSDANVKLTEIAEELQQNVPEQLERAQRVKQVDEEIRNLRT